MADWRQIQARIRKARNSRDPAAKLSELYQRTRDGMVAWEIGAVEEKNGRSDEAVKWYKVAAEKFRRADWKKKAEDALARLGVEAPEKHEPTGDELESQKPLMRSERAEMQEEAALPLAVGEIAEDVDDDAADDEAAQSIVGAAAAPEGASADGMRKKRRRGRRGGRGRRRKGGAGAAPGLPSQAFASSGSSPHNAASTQTQQPTAAASTEQQRAAYETPQREPQRPARTEPAHQPPQLPSERAAHGRSDPALSSRMAHLESLLRRLMQSPLHRLGEADEAPAGPGVFLLSEADQSGSYYVEACQTLRVGVGNLVRGVRTQKGNRSRFNDTNLKQQLAEYLGINEAKVSQYLKDHCVVRWIQLDEEASNLAHFAIGILRTPLNVD
ncbi:MAG TPA: hypothetical protein VJS43_12415 [Candidatus Acidoferrales bacterium]|nr:hypothetical protein [Candidatus Acidoferrales bacterium]